MICKLRSYAPADFETLYELDQLCYDPAIAYSRRELRNYLRFPGAACVIAEVDGGIAGFCVTSHRDARGTIITLDVREEFRRRGVGTSLISEAESKMAAAGVRHVELETATASESAVAFWQKHGYLTLGIRKGYYPGGRDAFTMTKSIAAQSASAGEKG